jgi:hypothetical protein
MTSRATYQNIFPEVTHMPWMLCHPMPNAFLENRKKLVQIVKLFHYYLQFVLVYYLIRYARYLWLSIYLQRVDRLFFGTLYMIIWNCNILKSCGKHSHFKIKISYWQVNWILLESQQPVIKLALINLKTISTVNQQEQVKNVTHGLQKRYATNL